MAPDDNDVNYSGPQPDPTVHLKEYQYISQFSTDSVVGINIYIAGALGDPDSQIVTVFMYDINNDPVISGQIAVRESLGVYQITFTPAQVSTPGFYSLVWSFTIATNPQSTTTYVQVGAENPDYDVLEQPMKDIIDITWSRFADMFDSPQGGPNLQTYFQSNFSRGRMAQLLTIAVGYLNTMAQPYTSFNVVNPGIFPYWQWGPLLEQALYIEVIKHLIRSYTEIPDPVGVTVSRNDRRDYINRWQSMLQLEMPMFQAQVDVFKISMMGLGRPRALVSGGVYGSYGPTRLPGSAAARPRYWTRFY